MNLRKAHKLVITVEKVIEKAIELKNTKVLYLVKEEVYALMQNCDEGDYRSGYETYGYGDNNLTHLLYISDRFNCQFRLRWLYDGIVGNKF
ncbi:MAG: hypothetical protein DRN17_06260 [Thermoplasmata archaeon]|nr:MAG: hypothetical protein DRN17_06260 [Thermoplasmata archaeon]